jgi:hypothetical protein
MDQSDYNDVVKPRKELFDANPKLQKSKKFVNMFNMVQAYVKKPVQKPELVKNKLYKQLSKNLITISQMDDEAQQELTDNTYSWFHKHSTKLQPQE